MINQPIFIYGPPGAGKSSIGRQMAESLNCDWLDLDSKIEEQADETIADIFNSSGEQRFRQLEKATLQANISSKGAIIILGGGTLLDESNRKLVESHGNVLTLHASEGILFQRLANDAVKRPLLADGLEEKLATLLSNRKDHYESFSIRIDTSNGSEEQIASTALAKLGLFNVQGMGDDYRVSVISHSLDGVGEDFRSLNLRGPVMIVSDDNVSRHYSDRVKNSLNMVGLSADSISITPGEANKNMQTITRLWDSFLTAGLERSSTVIALGGGVVGDLAGFAAATYLRGIAWMNIPTSILAMTDASLGGKTGVDLPQGKNLVGAFHPPKYVLCDPITLDTLPEVDLRSGLAETIKHGIIANQQLFNNCSNGLKWVMDHRDEVIRQSMAVKIKIIEEDPFERGLRASLNLGHTIGHAVETVSNYTLSHGDAVAIGMVVEAQIAETIGIAEKGTRTRIVAVLQKLGLPHVIPDELDKSTIIQKLQVDKKKSGGKVLFSLPVKVGEVRVGIEVKNLADII